MARIHHLDAGPMRPVGGALAAELPCRVVAIERDGGGIILIDTGLGVRARQSPGKHLGPVTALVARPDRSPERAAVAQLRALGLDPADVTDILMTHLDFDHASGLADFPNATVRLSQAEFDASRSPRLDERTRYLRVNWSHDVHWEPFGQVPPTEELLGFPAYLDVGSTGVAAIPMPGHTRGHTAYAIADGDGWLLHAGDAFYVDAQLQHGASVPRAITIFETVAAAQRGRIAGNHARLREVAVRDDVTVVCSHDPKLIARA